MWKKISREKEVGSAECGSRMLDINVSTEALSGGVPLNRKLKEQDNKPSRLQSEGYSRALKGCRLDK